VAWQADILGRTVVLPSQGDNRSFGGGGAASSSRQASVNVGSLLGVSWRAKQWVMLANKPYRTVRPLRTQHCGAQGKELEQHGTESTHGTNSTKAVTRETRPPLKA